MITQSCRSLSYSFLLILFGSALLVSAPGLSSRTLYYDEIFETRMALMPVTEQIVQYAYPEKLGLVVSPPLYHILLHPVLIASDITPFAVRSISWITGAVNVVLLYLLLRQLFSSNFAMLGTFGYMLSFWHLILSQTARQHSLFMMFVLLSLLSFLQAERRGKGFVFHTLFLSAASHTSFWGFLVVLPAHAISTVLMHKRLLYWRRLILAQTFAGLTALPYIFAIFAGYETTSSGGKWPVWSIPFFGSILVEFSSATWGWLDAVDLPWALLVTAFVSVPIMQGIRHWRHQEGVSERWLGLCLASCSILLFIGYLMGATHMAGAPLVRKFAILQIPLLISFLYGIIVTRSRGLGILYFSTWLVCTGIFGIKFIKSDYYKGSQMVAERISALPIPVTLYSNFDSTLRFLLERLGSTEGVESHSIKRRNINSQFISTLQLSSLSPGIICYSFQREGGYLAANLGSTFGMDGFASNPDQRLSEAVSTLTRRFEEIGWENVIIDTFPGRISYQLACFQKGEEAYSGDVNARKRN